MSVCERHAKYYLSLIQAANQNWQQIEAELEQVRRAWAWVSRDQREHDLILAYASAMRSYQNRRGLWKEQITWCGSALETARIAQNREEEGALLHNIGWCYHALGNQQLALDYLQKSLVILNETDNQIGKATTLTGLGTVYKALGEAQRALALYEQSLAIRQGVCKGWGESDKTPGI